MTRPGKHQSPAEKIDRLLRELQAAKGWRGRQGESKKFNNPKRGKWMPPDPRSDIPSTWQAFEEACRVWGVPRDPVETGFRLGA